MGPFYVALVNGFFKLRDDIIPGNLMLITRSKYYQLDDIRTATSFTTATDAKTVGINVCRRHNRPGGYMVLRPATNGDIGPFYVSAKPGFLVSGWRGPTPKSRQTPELYFDKTFLAATGFKTFAEAECSIDYVIGMNGLLPNERWYVILVEDKT